MTLCSITFRLAVDMDIHGYIHGYYAGTPANLIDYFICFVSHTLTFASFIFN